MYHGPYGSVSHNAAHATVSATAAQLWAWAHRTGASWPLSRLARLDTSIVAVFDSNGLCDVSAAGIAHEEWQEVGPDADEFNAWSSDALRDAISDEHPAWYVSVGQFLDERERMWVGKLPIARAIGANVARAALAENLHFPDLSGEWADDPTPDTLARKLLGDGYPERGMDGEVIEALCDAWESGRDEVYAEARP